MAEKIKVIIKEPGKAPEIKTVANDLGTLQSIVGGYIETVTLAVGLVIICNEEGKLWNLPYNFDFGGQSFVGTVVIAGIDGDNFASFPEQLCEWIPISDGEAAECSECGEYFEVSENGGMASFNLFSKYYKYCPNCGAKMGMAGDGSA